MLNVNQPYEERSNVQTFKRFKRFPLCIHRFNNSEKYTTRLVELPFNNKTITTISLPTLRTNIILPELGHIARKFQAKEYSFADQMIPKTNTINNFDLVACNNDA